jgi:metal-responsive CopG/Arc/MetJ family transcriptional regulator
MTTMAQAAAKDSKARIINEFQQILANRQTIASRVATREEEAEKEQNRSVLEVVSQYTADGIVRGLADLQLEFGTIITGLSSQLTTETAKLDDLKRAIAAESQNLQDLRQTRVVADALYLLTQEHQENLRLLEQRLTSDREILEKEITETRKLWQREQEEFDLSSNDSAEVLQRERQRQEADYQYDNERSRKIATDDYEETQRQIERELQETRQAKEKDWAERERTLAANQTLLEEYQRKVATIPTELDEAIKKSREEGIRDANQDAKVKADLLEKEWESMKQGYEFQLQSLEAKVQKQTEQISETTTQLQTALRQAQELAMRAFDSSSTRSGNG